MVKTEKEIVKKLAGKTLRDKWYKILEGAIDIDANDRCCFCHDKHKRHPNNTFTCKGCYLKKYDDIICDNIDVGMDIEDIKYIIHQLEILEEYGEIQGFD